MTTHATDPSLQSYARVAGAAYLLVIVLAMLSMSVIDARLIVPGDSAATTSNILAHRFLFRLEIACVLAMYASVVVLSLALYVVLRSVDGNLALLALLLRSAEAILGAATVLLSFAVLALLDGAEQEPVFGAGAQSQSFVGLLLDVRMAGLDIVLVFVGLGGTIFCWLFFRSRYVPRALSAWGIFTYLSMLFLALMSIIFPDHPALIENVLYALGALFELVFGSRLLVTGVRLAPGAV